MKGNPEKVHPAIARQAWENSQGDRKRVYSEYIRLVFRATGRLTPGCNNADLQAWLDKEIGR